MDSGTGFLMQYIADYLAGDVQQWEFDLDYDGYVVDYFPALERSDPALAKRFANHIDCAVETARRANLPEKHFRMYVADAYNRIRWK